MLITFVDPKEGFVILSHVCIRVLGTTVKYSWTIQQEWRAIDDCTQKQTRTPALCVFIMYYRRALSLSSFSLPSTNQKLVGHRRIRFFSTIEWESEETTKKNKNHSKWNWFFYRKKDRQCVHSSFLFFFGWVQSTKGWIYKRVTTTSTKCVENEAVKEKKKK